LEEQWLVQRPLVEEQPLAELEQREPLVEQVRLVRLVPLREQLGPLLEQLGSLEEQQVPWEPVVQGICFRST
jgi:hypothetical protein